MECYSAINRNKIVPLAEVWMNLESVIPWMEESGRLQSMGLLSVRRDWATSLSPFTFMHWRRKYQPTPVFLPGKSHGQSSLEGCSPWGRWELDTTEQLHFHFSLPCIGEGNSNPLQCSCLENPRDGGAWWAAVSRVAQSQTWLKRLSSSSSSYVFHPFGSIIPESSGSQSFSLEVSVKFSRDSIEGNLFLFVFVFGFQQAYYDISGCGFSFIPVLGS